MKRTAAAVLSLTLSAGSAMASVVEGSGIIVLNYTAAASLYMEGSAAIKVPTKAVYVNSNSATAIQTIGQAVLDSPEVFVVGHAMFNGKSKCTGTVTQSAVAFVNPLSNISIPNEASAEKTFPVAAYSSGAAITMDPGYYPAGVLISGNSKITMNPGIYHVAGAGFVLTSGSVWGQGVCVIVHSGTLSVSGSSSFYLVPPTDGHMAGVVLCQPSSNATEITLAGNSNTDIWGSIYAPGTRLNLVGSSSAAGTAMMGDLVVSDRLHIAGIGSLTIGHANLVAIALPKLPLAD